MFATYVLRGKDEVNAMYDNHAMRHMRTEDIRSERRIIKNRIRRRREMRKNFLILVMTVCLIITCSVALSGFRANAKDDSSEVSYKYYKSVFIQNDDTLVACRAVHGWRTLRFHRELYQRGNAHERAYG